MLNTPKRLATRRAGRRRCVGKPVAHWA